VALQIAPHAEALRNGPFKDGLLTACRNIGHRKGICLFRWMRGRVFEFRILWPRCFPRPRVECVSLCSAEAEVYN